MSIQLGEGLAGVEVDETSISFPDTDQNRLIYRGYDIAELCRQRDFEAVSFLLLQSRLPIEGEAQAWNQELLRSVTLPPALLDLISSLRQAHPMDVLRTALSWLGAQDSGKGPWLAALVAAVNAIVAAHWRARQQISANWPETATFSAAFLKSSLGESFPDWKVQAFDRLRIIYMEHNFNAATFVARVAASTAVDPWASATAAAAALKGNIHGGAVELVGRQLTEIGSADRVLDFVDEKLGQKKLIMGFGHRVYKHQDPRSVEIRRLCEDLRPHLPNLPHFEVAEKLEAEMWARKKIPSNLDLYGAVLFEALGFTPDFFTALICTSRVVGWCAHIQEQMTRKKIIRPLGRYVGRPYVQLS